MGASTTTRCRSPDEEVTPLQLFGISEQPYNGNKEAASKRRVQQKRPKEGWEAMDDFTIIIFALLYTPIFLMTSVLSFSIYRNLFTFRLSWILSIRKVLAITLSLMTAFI